ncbi:hypothetical protein Tco_0445965 [Tanacetum coccineum]
MRELREDTFFRNKNEDTHDHIDRVLNIIGLFNIPRVSKDAVMLRVFPFTLTRAVKRWVDRLAPGTINTWDLLKKAFIQRYCPPSKTAKHLEDIYNFTQEKDKSLYQACERYNGLLYKCPTHDINSHQKVNIFYKGLSTTNRQLLDLQGPIPLMTPVQALTAIQSMADHSQKWHDETTSWNIGSSSSNDGLVALDLTSTRIVPSMRKLNKLKRSDMENLDEQRLLKGIMEEDKSWVTTFAKEAVTKTDKNKDCKVIFTNDRAPLYTPFYYSHEEIEYFSANSGFSNDDEFKNVTSILDEDLKQTSPKQTTTHCIESYVPPILFPRRLEQHTKEALIHKTMESLKKTKSNRPFLKDIRQSDEYPKHMKDLVTNKLLIMENEDVRMHRRCSALLLNQLPSKEKDLGSFILPCSIGRLDFNNALADLGASISIMPFSMYKCLVIGKLEIIKMNIELANNSKCIPKGIVRNLLIKIDKFIFPIDFIILDVVEDFRMPIILGRPLLTTAHAKVNVFKKSISLEVGNEKVIFKMKSDLPDMRNESVLITKSNMITEEDELMNIETDLFTYITNTCESCHILAVDTDLFTYELVTQETYDKIAHKCCLTTQEAIGENTKPILSKRKPHWCTLIYRQNNGIQEVWASCNPSNEECNGRSLCNNEIRCYWESENDNNHINID